jgi:hypothetical protein
MAVRLGTYALERIHKYTGSIGGLLMAVRLGTGQEGISEIVWKQFVLQTVFHKLFNNRKAVCKQPALDWKHVITNVPFVCNVLKLGK